MNRFEFLSKLSTSLSGLTPEDRRRVTDYYTEMIDDRIEEGLTEEEAIASIGDPENDAREMLSALGIECAAQNIIEKAAEEELRKTGNLSSEKAYAAERMEGAAQSGKEDARTDSGSASAGLSDEAIERAIRNIAAPEKPAQPERPAAPRRPVRRRRVWGLILLLFLVIAGTAAAVTVGKTSIRVISGLFPFGGIENLKEQMPISSKPKDIKIIGGSGDIKFETVPGSKVKLNMSETAAESYEVKEIDDQLVIEYKSGRNVLVGFFFLFGRNSNDLVISLPLEGTKSSHLYNVEIETTSGDIELPKTLAVYESLKLKTSSGDIRCKASLMCDEAVIETSSGDVDCACAADQPSPAKILSVQTSSGDIEISGYTVHCLKTQSSSGDVRIRDVALKEFTITSSSGEVELSEQGNSSLKLERFSVTTTSGDVELRLNTVPAINTRTNSGRVSVSSTGAAPDGSFEIRTTSGDIIVK